MAFFTQLYPGPHQALEPADANRLWIHMPSVTNVGSLRLILGVDHKWTTGVVAYADNTLDALTTSLAAAWLPRATDPVLRDYLNLAYAHGPAEPKERQQLPREGLRLLGLSAATPQFCDRHTGYMYTEIGHLSGVPGVGVGLLGRLPDGWRRRGAPLAPKDYRKRPESVYRRFIPPPPDDPEGGGKEEEVEVFGKGPDAGLPK